jgi:hypothetical protein
MPVRQGLSRVLGAPVRRFFDRRFTAVDASVKQVAASTQTVVERELHTAVDPMHRRLDTLAHEISVVSRAQLESMSYVGNELRALDQRITDEMCDLRLALAQGSDAQGLDALAHPYAIRALASLDAGARVVTLGFDSSPTPLSLAALGFRVTAVGPRPYVHEHVNLDVVVGRPEELRERFDAVVWSHEPGQRGQRGIDRLRRSVELLEPGGLVVLVGAPDDHLARSDGLELVDRTAAHLNGDEPSPVLLTARRS